GMSSVSRLASAAAAYGPDACSAEGAAAAAPLSAPPGAALAGVSAETDARPRPAARIAAAARAGLVRRSMQEPSLVAHQPGPGGGGEIQADAAGDPRSALRFRVDTRAQAPRPDPGCWDLTEGGPFHTPWAPNPGAGAGTVGPCTVPGAS